MTTARDLITGSLQLLGTVFKGESIAPDEAEDGLARLNELIESWANDSLLCYARIWESFPLTTNTSTYTIGQSGTFNTLRPVQIISAYVNVGSLDYPIRLINDDEYALEILSKFMQSAWPIVLNYDNGFPIANIRVWPLPSSTPQTLHMQSEKQLSDFGNLSNIVSLPPGWAKALRYNLAMDLAPEYGVQPDPLIVETAAKAKGDIKLAVLKNRPIKYLGRDAVHGYNIYTGLYK